MGVVLWILAAALLLFLLAEAAGAAFFVRMITRPKVEPAAEQYKKLMEANRITEEDYASDRIRKEAFFLPSVHGYPLFCELLTTKESRKKENRKRVAIMSHGLTSCRYGMLPYARLYRKRGFSVVLYDQRNHGESGVSITTLGYQEKDDLKTVADWCFERFGADIHLVTHGGSMGAATVLCHLKEDDRVACAVEDCGFSDFREEMIFQARNRYHVPAYPVVPIIRLFARIRHGIDLYRIRPMDGAVSSKTPILFIHGEEDDFIPISMMEDMVRQRKGPAQVLRIPGAGHGASILTDYSRYEEAVGRFLDTYYPGD